MFSVSIEEAVAQLPQLIEKANHGVEVILTENSHPVARLVALAGQRAPRKPGSASGLILHITEDFDTIPEGFEEYMP